MRPAWLLVLASLLAVPTAADEIRFDGRLDAAGFEELAETVADALALAPAGPAVPLGVTGFDIVAVAGGPEADSDSSWWRYSTTADTLGGLAVAPRVMVRKGLPGRLDLGAHLGEVLGERFWGAEARWALLSGGVLEPALGLRLSYSQLTGAPLDLRVLEAQLVLSKGFAILTPYVAGGYRRTEAEARYGEPAPVLVSVTADRGTVSVGLRAALVPFRFFAEARQARQRSFFVGIGVGL